MKLSFHTLAIGLSVSLTCAEIPKPNDAPTSVTLAQANGWKEVVLRKNIKELRSVPVSLMPENLSLSPRDCADLLEWMRKELTTR